MKINQIESKCLIAIHLLLFLLFQEVKAMIREQDMKLLLDNSDQDNSIIFNIDNTHSKSTELEHFKNKKQNNIKNISTKSTSSTGHTLEGNNKYENNKWVKLINEEIERQSKRMKASEEDHSIMQKWLVDNINDLHRELKQTEMDFEHYVQVTKNILASNERQLKLQKQFSLTTTSRGLLAQNQPLTLMNVPTTIELDNKQISPIKALIFSVPN